MVLAIPAVTHRVHASGLTGVAYINPPSTNQTLPMGSTFTVTVQVSGMDYFTGWDIYIQTNESVINPISITTVGALFANYTIPPTDTLYELANCVNGVPAKGTCTGSLDGPGVAHSAVAYLSQLSNTTIVPPVLGTLFSITYNVVRAGGWSPIDIVSSAFENGTVSQTGVAHTVESGTYGIEPSDFKLLPANPSSLSVFQGSNVTTTITVESIAGFSGAVNLTASNELGAVFAQPILTLSPGGTSSTQLTLVASTATLATHYPKVTVTASNRTLSHSISLDVNVNTFPDFQLKINPSRLLIHSGNSANTTVTLQSQNTFSGYVNLTMQVPVNVTAVLGSTRIFLSANGFSQTGLNITTPFMALPFLYTINVTATGQSVSSGSTFQLIQMRQLIIKPPAPTFMVVITPPRLIMRAGLTSSVQITITSEDYAWQYLYLSATMSGGSANFDNNSFYVPLPNTPFGNIQESANFTLTVQVPTDQVIGPYEVLLTVYQNSPIASQNAPTQTIGIPVTVASSSLFHAVSNPTVLGLSPPTYFGILGLLVIPFIILSVYSYRKAREDEDEDWKS